MADNETQQVDAEKLQEEGDAQGQTEEGQSANETSGDVQQAEENGGAAVEAGQEVQEVNEGQKEGENRQEVDGVEDQVPGEQTQGEGQDEVEAPSGADGQGELQEQSGQEPLTEEAAEEAPQEAVDATQEAENATQEAEDATQETEQDQNQGDSQEPEQTASPAKEAEEEGQAQEQADEAESTRPDEEQDTLQHSATNAATATEPGVAESDVDPDAPSPSLKFNSNDTATVKFVLMPSGQVVTLRCPLGQTLDELRAYFARDLKMPVDVILFMLDGSKVQDSATLGDLGVGPNGTIQLEIQSSDPIDQPIKPWRPKEEHQMPDVITVRVNYDHNEYKDIVVEIERSTRKKPFLGGYRHKETAVEYHHASAQTQQKPRPPSNVEKFCRDTQTMQMKHGVQQTKNEMSTQMTKVGVYVSNMEDKLMVPGKYTTSDEFHGTIQTRVLIIQKYYRRWLAKRFVDRLKRDKEMRLQWEREEEIRKKHEKEQRIQREFMRRMNPKTKEDFDLLYHALEKWKQEEKARIDSTLTGAERKAALCHLLEQETQLLAAIGRHKIDADTENKQRSVSAFLDKAAAPKKWKGPDGKATEMDTPYTIRAQQLRDIYNSINMKYLTQDERLDVLLTLKHTVKEHDCKLTQEIIQLIDREADLLMRGVQEGNLEGLRKRIATLFLQYIKTPTFNPEAARLLKVPQDPSSLQKNVYFCSGCNKYLLSTEFPLSSNSESVSRCRECTKVENDSRTRQDFSHYRYMLRALQRAEENYADNSKIAFLLQEVDLRHLVENVWSSQSALSASDDLYDLVLVRWERHEEWSPWNCCLLTKEEASAHDRLQNLEEAYGKSFIHKIKHRHTLARNYFARLPGMAEHVRARVNSASTQHSGVPSVSGKSLVSSARA